MEEIKDIETCTVKEFFTFLNDKKTELKVQNDSLKKRFIPFKNYFEYVQSKDYVYCYVGRIYKNLKTVNGKKNFSEILENVFGPKFFTLTEDEMKIYKEKNLYTRDEFYKLIDPIIGNKNGVSINLPNNFDDFVELIDSCLTVICDDSIHVKVKEPYSRIYNIIEQIIGGNFKKNKKESLENDIIINKINEIMKLVNRKKLIDEDKELLKGLDKALLVEKVQEDGTTVYVPCNFGEITKRFINKYNDGIKKINGEKELKSMVNKYYKKLTKTKPEKLIKSDFPNYEDANVVIIYKSLIEKLNDAVLKKEALNDIRTTTELMYAGYFTSPYYDEEKVFEKHK